MSRTILYYPNIEVPTSGLWIRRALLYWDKIAAIVPKSYDDYVDNHGEPHYSHEIKELRDQEIYLPVNPAKIWESGNAIALEEDVRQYIMSTDFRLLRTGPFDVPIYRDKASDFIIQLLIEQGLAEDRNHPVLYFFKAGTAALYMALLAKHIAAGIGAIPATDQELLSNIAFGKNIAGKLEPVLSARLEDMMPIPRSSISLSKILTFRKKYEPELLSFRATIDEFETNLAKAEDSHEIVRLVQQFKEHVVKDTENLGKALKAFKISMLLGSLQAFIKSSNPTFLIGAAGVVAGKAYSISSIPISRVIEGAVAAGLVSVSANLFGKIQERREALKDTPFAYLFLAKKKLA